jgi:hypothetical protein
MKVRYLAFVLLVSALSCATVWGQATAQINGTVSDSTGALIPGAEVTATQTATGIARTTVTNERGAYILPTCRLARIGSKRLFRDSGHLFVNATRSVNAVLEVGQVSETVEVQSDAVMVETRATGVGEVINNTQILELPLVGRETQDLIASP